MTDETPPTPQDVAKRALQRLADTPDWSSVNAQPALRRAVGACWPYIDHYTRSKFVACLDNELMYVAPDWDESTGDPFLDHIIKLWHVVLPFAKDGKERAFMNDVNRRRKSSQWRPSPKQADWMKRLWVVNIGNCFYEDRVQEQEPDLIEIDEG